MTGHLDLRSLDRYYQSDPSELAQVAKDHQAAQKAGLAAVGKAEADRATASPGE